MKTIQKLLCLVLLVAMLLPSVILPASATEGAEVVGFENLYSADAGKESKPDTNGRTFYKDVSKVDYWYTTGVIAVSAGDKITFGPYPERLQVEESIYLYSDDAAKTIVGRYFVQNSSIDCTVTGTIFGNLKIYTYTVPEDGTVGSIRLSFPKIYKDQFLVTREHQFTKDEYYNYMKTVEGKDVSFVPDVAVGANLKDENLFTSDVKGIIRRDSTVEEGYTLLSSDTTYYQFFEDVQAGDIFYFVAPDVLDLGLNLVTSFVDNKFLQLKASDLICVETVGGADPDGNPYAIFAYKVGSAVDKIAIMTKLPEGQRIVTKNLRFDRKMYLEFIGYEIPNLTNIYASTNAADRKLKSTGSTDNKRTDAGYAESVSAAYYHTIIDLKVAPGEKITVGPYPENFDGKDEDFSLITYTKSSNSSYKDVVPFYTMAEVTGTIIGNMKIYTYTAPEDGSIYRIRFMIPQNIAYQYVNGERVSRVLITRNYQFTGEEYFDYMREVEGIEVKFADDVATLDDPKTELTAANLFGPTKEELGYITEEGVEKKDEQNTDAYYTLYTRANGDFETGDTFYFVGPIATDNNGYALADVVFGNYNDNFATTFTTGFPLKAEELTLLEDLGNGRGVYSYTVSADVCKLSILGYNNVVPKNEQLITKNLRFDKELYHDYIDGHNYATPDYDVKYHWIECECGSVKDKVAHDLSYKTEDILHWQECGGCDYETEKTEHIYTLPENDDSYHWNKCECGVTDTKIAHEMGYKFNDTQHWYACDGCEYTIGTPADHEFEPGRNETTHWEECSTCGKEINTSGHEFNTQFNDTHHWTACDCGETTAEQEHEYDNACDTTCNVCGDERATEHVFTLYGSDETHHWKECSVCGVSDEETKAEHNYGAAGTVCVGCGRLKCTAHKFTVLKTDEQKHWKVCSECGTIDETSVAEHSYTVFDKSLSEHWKVCSTCAAKDNSSVEGHKFAYVCDSSCDCGLVREIVHDFCIPAKDATHHWNACSLCSAAGEKTAHTFGEWTVEGDVQSRACDCGYVETKAVIDDGTTVEPDDDGTTAEPDDDGTTAEPDDGTTAEPDDEETYPEITPKKGCGSVVSATLGFAALALLAPAALVLRKKEDEE